MNHSSPVQSYSGRVISGLLAAFLAFSAGIKLAGHPSGPETLAALGWPPESAPWLGLLEAAILVLYLVPRTAILGALLLTGLLGGAMATHVRADSPLFSHVLFGFHMGLFAWGGLWLRDPRLRALLPLRR
jgi:hypothetical protein